MDIKCRACLSIIINDEIVMMDKSFVEKYNEFTNLNVKYNADEPVYTCQACFEAFNYCVEFKEKCISSDKKFMEYLTLKPSTNSTVQDSRSVQINMKQEIKQEYDSGDMYENEYPYIDHNNDSNGSDTKISTLLKGTKKSTKVIKSPTKNLNELFEDRKEELKIKVKEEKVVDNLENAEIHCGICTKKFQYVEGLMKHLDKHKEGCDICYEKFLDFTELLAHRITHLPDDQKKCHICFKRYVTANTLEYHYIQRHNHRSRDPNIYCKVCRKPYKSAKCIRNHMSSVHMEKRFKCNKCDKMYRDRSALNSHMIAHKTAKTLKCEVCDYSCKWVHRLKEHVLRRHVPGSVSCKACEQVFKDQCHLDAHVCKYARGVVCPVCGVTYSKPKCLRIHMRTHDNETKLKCNRCDAKFSQGKNLKVHMNRHDNIRPYLCEFCPRAFYGLTVLVKHRRTHTGERPYKCKLCDSAFTRNHNLKVHMKVHGLDLIVKKKAQPNTQ